MIHAHNRALAIGGLCAALIFPGVLLADTDADEAAIRAVWATYTEARVAGDAETWLGLWDPEGMRLAPGAPAQDFASFAPGTPERFANPPKSMAITPEEIVVTGDWAYSRGTFLVNDAVEGKFLTILKRQDDGSWAIYRDSFSMNAP